MVEERTIKINNKQVKVNVPDSLLTENKSVLEEVYGMDLDTLRKYCKDLLGRNGEQFREIIRLEKEYGKLIKMMGAELERGNKYMQENKDLKKFIAMLKNCEVKEFIEQNGKEAEELKKENSKSR